MGLISNMFKFKFGKVHLVRDHCVKNIEPISAESLFYGLSELWKITYEKVSSDEKYIYSWYITFKRQEDASLYLLKF